jgi:hypothetical protein
MQNKGPSIPTKKPLSSKNDSKGSATLNEALDLGMPACVRQWGGEWQITESVLFRFADCPDASPQQAPGGRRQGRRCSGALTRRPASFILDLIADKNSFDTALYQLASELFQKSVEQNVAAVNTIVQNLESARIRDLLSAKLFWLRAAARKAINRAYSAL